MRESHDAMYADVTPISPTVLIFKESLLPMSETFIEAQAQHLREFTARYIGLGRVSPSLSVGSDSILLTSGQSIVAKGIQRLYRRVAYAPRFHRRALSAKACLIHAHFASGGRSALPLAGRLKIPLIVTLHGSDVTTRVDYRKRYRQLWNEATLFLCVSNFIRQKAIEAGFPETKLRVHYIGVDQDVFRSRNESRHSDTVLFIGRLVEKKGCAVLLHAMAVAKRSRPGVRTVVIGDGPLRQSLEALGRRLGISCHFMGTQSTEVVRRWLSVARVLCVPSVTASNGDSEGLGMVFGEAQAMGTPVVSSRHGGIPEIVVDGCGGLLTPEADYNALAIAVVRLLEDEELWEQCAKRGLSWVRTRFDLRAQTAQLEQIYLGLC
jgi:colanic acid/amylovoran biosynthesis glycosyltransferase